MSSKTDFYMVAGLAIAIAYANLVGPHRLIQHLYPNGEFILKGLASGMLTFSAPEKLAALATSERADPAGRPARPAAAKLLTAPKPALPKRVAR